MKKILNWTFGGFFRAFGRILCFLIVGGLIAYLIASNDFKLPDILSFGIIKVHASEINYTGQFRLQYYQLSTGTTALTNVGPFNTGQTLSSGYGVSKVITRYSGQTFNAGTIYRVQTIVGFAPSEIASSFRTVDSIGCFGTTSSSNWNADSSLVASCDIVGISQIPNTNRIKYIVDITPASNLAGIQFNINYAITEEVRTVNVYTASTITTGPDIAGSIDEQTAIIEEEFDNLSNIINQNNQNLINSITEQNEVCEIIDDQDITKDSYITNNGSVAYATGTWGATDFINIYDSKVEILTTRQWQTATATCFYDRGKQYISCINTPALTLGLITLPQDAYYMRMTIDYTINKPTAKVCKNGNQALSDELHGLGKGIHDNNTSEATSEASDFFNSFSTNTHGLTSIVTAPLNAITSLSSSTCSPLHLPIPYLDNKYIDLPCMRTIYDTNFGSFMNLYDTIIFGIVSYWIIVRIFALVKDFKNPEHDEIEVVDL